ncbi:MAG: hypothetical protein K6F47_09655 [Bacteroidaceae bacterium]|nr:hypothetical protein [Bacteroidaceae bacterium]
MEEQNNLTAERSLEIITEQIERSRRAVSKDTGQFLFIAGLMTMGTAVVAAPINYFTLNAGGMFPGWWGHFLWFVLPFFIMLALRYIDKGNAPVSLVGTQVRKVWWTFATFALIYAVYVVIWNGIMFQMNGPEIYPWLHRQASSIIILLMAMAISITGHILKIRWLVWLGICGWLLIYLFSGLSGFIMVRILPSSEMARLSVISPCPSIFFFALIGLTLPGLILKRQK